MSAISTSVSVSRRARRMKTRVVVTLALAALAVAVWMAMPAFAAGTTQISGLQTVFSSVAPVTSCPETGTVDPVYEMAGSLVGCWYTDSIDVFREHPGGTIQLAGTEHFVGCMNPQGACTEASPTYGRFDTTFTYTARFDPTTGLETHGRCHHPIVSGDGYFAGAKGVLDFTDNVTHTPTDYPYTGHLTIQ